MYPPQHRTWCPLKLFAACCMIERKCFSDKCSVLSELTDSLLAPQLEKSFDIQALLTLHAAPGNFPTLPHQPPLAGLVRGLVHLTFIQLPPQLTLTLLVEHDATARRGMVFLQTSSWVAAHVPPGNVQMMRNRFQIETETLNIRPSNMVHLIKPSGYLGLLYREA